MRSIKIALALLFAVLLLVPGIAWATFPTVETTATSSDNTNDTSTIVVNLPSGIQNGNLLVCGIAMSEQRTASWPAGWTELYDTGPTGYGASAAFRRADGSEGASITVTASGTTRGNFLCYRISGHHASTDPEDGTEAQGNNANPDAPSLSPSWGAEDTLWIVMTHHDQEWNMTVAPTSYGNIITSASGSTVSGMASARRTNNTATENPATSTNGGSGNWVANTIAIRPAAVGGGGTAGRLMLMEIY